MPDDPSFQEFLNRLRAGDEEAAAELVRRYERIIRLEVRTCLNHPGRFPAMDSEDICQSVLASFFTRAAAGQYDLEQPEQLVGLLVAMARHKAAFASRHPQAQRRVVGVPVEEVDPAGGSPTPNRLVAGRELLQQVLNRLTAEERRLADLRGQGHTWSEIAQEVSGDPDTLRVQLTRALDRVLRQLDLEDTGEE